MKLTFLGTCSGTEPMAGRRHCSIGIEAGGGLYMFDAGEGCSRAAHLAGMDLLSLRAIFITHCHWDHVGGLAGLAWVASKLVIRSGGGQHKLSGKTIDVLIPNTDIWLGACKVLGHGPKGPDMGYTFDARTYDQGGIFDDGVIKVQACRNAHMGLREEGLAHRSFSLRIEHAGKAVVDSGDVADVSELTSLIAGGCDTLIMETGHHLVEDVCTFLRDSGTPIGRLVFNHHGRAILADPAGEKQKAQAIMTCPVIVADDGMTLDI